MRSLQLLPAITLLISMQTAVSGAAPALTPAKATIGRNLQAAASVSLSEPVPEGGIQLTLTSSDPSRLLLSRTPELAGAPSITITVRERFRESPEFWLHALAASGEVRYTASAPGYSEGKGIVSLTPSGIVMRGPFGLRNPHFPTTPRALPSKITLYTARLDSSLQVVDSQLLRGGLSLKVDVVSSNPSAGVVVSPVTIEAASETAGTEFKPAGAGDTTLSVTQPPGFSPPAGFTGIAVNVKMPGIGIADDTLIVGENLQAGATVSLGEPAPEGGVAVTLTSSDPSRLLLAANEKAIGTGSVTIKIPAGGFNARYCLQALSASGTPTHTATAPGYQSRTSRVVLAPSGIIIGTKSHGAPDEAQLFRPESSDGKAFVLIRLGEPELLTLYSAHLHPVTRRGADISVQSLRVGVSVDVDLANSNPAVGKLAPRVTLQGGESQVIVPFNPASAGTTIINLSTPKGFTTPSNATEMKATVVR